MTNILLKTESDVEKLTGIADAIQIEPEKIQLVKLDTGTELVDGWLFGASGRFKLWIKNYCGDVDKFVPAVDPMTYPIEGDTVSFDYGEMVVRRSGRIARLKIIE